LLQWSSPLSISQIAFNAFATLLSTTLGYGIAQKARELFLDTKTPATPSPLTQARPTFDIQQFFPTSSLSLSPQQAAQEIRYRALPKTEQIQKRTNLYQALYQLTQASEAKIPYLKDYRGYDIYLSRDGHDLIMRGKNIYNWNKLNVKWTIQLAPNGQYKSSFSKSVANANVIITVINGTEIVLEHRETRWGKKDEGTKDEKTVIEFINRNKAVTRTELPQKFLDHDHALMELLTFKQEQIVASFQKQEWNTRLNSLLTNILSLFDKIRNQRTSTPSSDALISPLNFSTSKSITLGPIWSPVAASQDSFFKWKIEYDAQDNIYLEFEKYASDHGMMMEVSSRTMRFKQNAKRELFVDFLKGHSDDLENSSSEVSYQLQFKGSQLFFIPLSAQSQYYCCLLGNDFQNVTDQLPAPEHMKAHFEQIISNLITVGDIICRPESVIIACKVGEVMVKSTRNSITQEQAEQLIAFNQGLGCSGAMLYSRSDILELATFINYDRGVRELLQDPEPLDLKRPSE
jgi:hypothetical protein